MSGIDEIYDGILDDAAYARIPAVLADTAQARSAIAIALDSKMEAQQWVRHAVSDEVMARYQRHELWRHDLWSHLMARPRYRNQTVRSDEVIDVESFRDSVFYNELYRPLGDDTARCLGVVLDRPGGTLAIGLHRAYKHAAFDAADVAAVQALVPHIHRVVQARHQIRHAAEKNVLITAALDTLAHSVLVLNADCRLVHANQAAEEILKSGDGLAWTAGRIVPQEAQMAATFSEAVRSAATASANRGGAVRLRRSEQPPLRALIVPLNQAIGFALVLINPDRPLGLSAILAQMYHLTEAEAGLAMLLQEGHSPSEAAALRGVRLSTVRTQIQSLLSKMEARSLGDLLRSLSGVPSTI